MHPRLILSALLVLGSFFLGGDALGAVKRERLETAVDQRGGAVERERGQLTCRPDPQADHLAENSNIVYATVPRGDGLGTFGLMLDAHIPMPGGPYPALVFVHGGGWVSGARTGEDGSDGAETYARQMASLGPFVVFNIDYRMPCTPDNHELEYFDNSPHLSPRAAICTPAHTHPIPLADVRAAIQWVRENGHLFNADVTRIGIVGDSAGGHLAMLAAMYDGPADMASVKPHVAVAFSPPSDFDLTAQLAYANNGTPNPPVPVSTSPEGAEFDECAFVQYEPALEDFEWSNAGTNCAAYWYRSQLVGQNYELGELPEAVASRAAWSEASPRRWVGNTDPAHPDPPIYLFIGVGEQLILEQEGQSVMDAAAQVPTMAGSGFCKLSVANVWDRHASDFLGNPVEAGCYGYGLDATQITVLESAVRFLRNQLPYVPGCR
jgi:acetyl esterase/lipase